jgi:NTP pyrophosphatase (non-canonical NTP hydrolase)
MTSHSITELQEQLADFAAERDWGKFHTPKNLAMALAGEAGELLAEFQWMTPEESQQAATSDSSDSIRMEMADVFIYLIRLADLLKIDLVVAAKEKISLNSKRFLPQGKSPDTWSR